MYGVLHVGFPVRSYTQSDEQMNNSIQLFIISCGDTRLTSQKMRRDHPQKRLQPADLAVRPMILSSLPPGYQESEHGLTRICTSRGTLQNPRMTMAFTERRSHHISGQFGCEPQNST